MSDDAINRLVEARASALNISAMSETAAPPRAAAPIPTHAELFLAFFKITLSGFGGTLPWTRRMFVEEKRWMTAEEFNDVYALCQFLPGPNIVNLTVGVRLAHARRDRGAGGVGGISAGAVLRDARRRHAL